MENFQSLASKQGYIVEEISDIRFVDAGFEIADKKVDLGSVEVDRIYTNKNGISFYTTIKGSFRGKRPGIVRTDTLKKAVAEAFFIGKEGWGPVLLVTTHIPKRGRGAKMLKIAEEELFFAIINIADSRDFLYWLANANVEELIDYSTVYGTPLSFDSR